MSYYNLLDIGNYLGHEVSVILHDGRGYIGRLCDGLTNEDWKEDNEFEALALEISGEPTLIEIDLYKIKHISKILELTTIQQAV